MGNQHGNSTADLRRHEMMSDKFRGCLVGGLVGDCHGRVFEFMSSQPNDAFTNRVNTYFLNRKNGERNDMRPYTDDTAMATALAKSLIKKRRLDIHHLARGFVKEWGNFPGRGYALSMSVLLMTLLEKTDVDVLQPARERYNGEGSCGNGAAMRIAPVALFFHKDKNLAIQASYDQSLITHTHYNGYNGAILLSLAIQEALSIPSYETINKFAFLEVLRKKMEVVESNRNNPEERIYCLLLDKIKELLEKGEPPSLIESFKALGNEIIAQKSVPTAIYAFLAGQDPIPYISATNSFERIIQFAICLAGDTDTIACMAGYIEGAHKGLNNIPTYLQSCCEDCDKVIELANRLYKVSKK